MQLLKLRVEDSPDIERWIKEKHYLSGDILNEMIGLLGRNVLMDILADIRIAKWYALIADEATDVSNKEQLCVTIRWVDNECKIFEDFIELINVPKTDAETITDLLTDSMIRHQLPLSNCRGQAYDGAANMSGHISGVAARIQEKEPAALYVHCLAHSINLCLQTVGKQITAVREALGLVQELGVFISFSPKRSSLLECLKSQICADTPTIKTLCLTRWTVRTNAIQAVVANYEILLKLLLEVHEGGRDEYAMKAGGYLASMDKFSTFWGLKLSHLIFSAVEQLSITLQAKNTTMQDAVESSKLAMNFLQRQRSEESFERFYTRVVEDSQDLTSSPILPRYRKLPRRLDDGTTTHRFETPKSLFKQQYNETLDLLGGELTKRFQQKRGMPIAAALETLVSKAFSEDFVFSFPEELSIYSKDVNFDRLKIQIQMLPDLLKSYNVANPSQKIKNVTNLRTVCDIMNSIESSKVMLSEVYKLLRISVTIPVTSSTAERTFSTLRRLKNYLRSTMSQPRLNHALLLHVHKDKTDNINLHNIAKEFILVNERRRNFFGVL